MSGSKPSRRAHGVVAVADRAELELAARERQLDDLADGQTVVRQENSGRHGWVGVYTGRFAPVASRAWKTRETGRRPRTAGERARRGGHGREIHARLVTHALEEEEKILRRDVAGRPGRVRAAAETAGGRVEDPHALAQSLRDVRERRAARVVEMQREPRRAARPAATVSRTTSGTCVGNADADRVADGHLVASDLDEPRPTTRATAAGATAPSYGQPNPHET